MLARADLPFIQAGSGVIHAGAYHELKEVAELLHAPVTTSWSGRGVLPETHELAWPMVHVKAVNQVRNAADLVLCLGCRLGETDWWGRPPNWNNPSAQKMIQVDIDENVLGRNKTGPSRHPGVTLGFSWNCFWQSCGNGPRPSTWPGAGPRWPGWPRSGTRTGPSWTRN